MIIIFFVFFYKNEIGIFSKTKIVSIFELNSVNAGRSMGIGPMRRPSDRKVDTSPYNGNMYLSLPNDSGWRRTSSDSAIHQNFVKNYVCVLFPYDDNMFDEE